MGNYLKKISAETYSIFHNPSIMNNRQFQVRLIGNDAGTLDNVQIEKQTRDAVGYGKTMEIAAKKAWGKKYNAN